MYIGKTSSVLSKFMALGLLGLLIFTVVVVPVRWTWSYLDNLRSELLDRRLMLGKLEAAHARLEVVTPAAGETGPTNVQFLLPGSTEAMRAAHLQQYLTDVMQTHRVQMRTASAAAPYTLRGFEFIGVQAAATASLKKIQDMLLQIQSTPLYLYIPEFEINRSNIAGAPPNLLDVRLTVYGVAERDDGEDR